GRVIPITWEGLDPDNPDPVDRPAFYEYKLIPVPDGNPETFVVPYIIDVTPGPEIPWTRAGADTTTVRLRLNPPQLYVFAVRAIDEAGGIESVFVKGRN